MIVSRFLNCKRSSRRGAVVVEFALVAPLFFLLTLGTVEFGHIMMVQEVEVSAARGGARTAILAGSSDANVQTTIANYMSAAGISGYTWTISPDLGSSPAPGSGTAITVTVSVPWSKVNWTGFLPSTWFSGTAVSASIVMIHE
ncbi:MAG: TadE/TadG family type IV pilus assembly protein [Thermoguttaceae bacterium]